MLIFCGFFGLTKFSMRIGRGQKWMVGVYRPTMPPRRSFSDVCLIKIGRLDSAMTLPEDQSDRIGRILRSKVSSCPIERVVHLLQTIPPLSREQYPIYPDDVSGSICKKILLQVSQYDFNISAMGCRTRNYYFSCYQAPWDRVKVGLILICSVHYIFINEQVSAL